MPTRLRSGVAVRLIAVLCVTAGCAAAQQQPPSAVFSTTPAELWQFIEQAVRVELQPLVRRLESRVDALDGRLVKLDSRVDELTVRLFDSSQNLQPDELSRRLDSQQSQLDKLVTMVDGQKSQLDVLITKVDGQTSQFDVVAAKMNSLQTQLDGLANKVDGQNSQQESLTTRLGRQESQLTELAAQLDDQQSQLAVLTATPTSEQSRLDKTLVNKTASQQTQIDELAGRLDQLEGEVGPGGSEPLPRDCGELSADAQSGVHLLQPGMDRSLPPVEAFCDLVTDGGNWTVFQRRTNIEPHQDFYLGWAAYKEGFGELSGEFWWGLDKLWRTTAAPNRRYELRVDLEDFAGEKRHAIYENFRISSEDDGFRLSADNYSGDAGDSLSPHVNHQFSTRDRDHDGISSGHCAQGHTGAWWHGNCAHSRLNGRYRDGPGDDRRGIWWITWKGYQSLKKTSMKIRRVV